MVAAIPEIKDRLDRESWVIRGPEPPRQYLVLEIVLNPVLRELLDVQRDQALLKRIFDFFEKMARSPDREVVNLLAVGVFEEMVDRRARMATAWPYMGSETKRVARQVARGLHRDQNLPAE
jgi:hypothetical protein